MDSDPSSFFSTIDFEMLTGMLAVFILLICSAFISGSEVALFSLSQKDIDDLEHEDLNKGSLIYYALLNDKKNYCSFLINYYIGVR